MTIKQAEEEYGTVTGFVDNLRELNALNDLRDSDIQETLRDINFIRQKAELKAYDYQDLILLIM